MRRRVAEKHRILPDARFGDTQVTTFVNNLMLDGKKSVALRFSTTPSIAFQNAWRRWLGNIQEGLETLSRCRCAAAALGCHLPNSNAHSRQPQMSMAMVAH